MAHLHEVKDSDTHFIINPVTMAISNAQNEKNKLQQGDHNSEIFTFQIPKEVEGHDMSLCDVVRVHYINTSTSKADISKDIHKVVDMAVAEDDAETLVFTWLIHGNATKYNGSLAFRILFACTDENDNYTYKKWTEIYKGISIGEGFENEETVLEAQADILKQEFDELEKQMEELTKELEEDISQLSEEMEQLKQSETGTGSGTGWNSTQITLLETIGDYLLFSDQNTGQLLFDNLITSLRNGSSSGGSESDGDSSGDSGGGNTGGEEGVNIYNVTISAQNTTWDNTETDISEGDSYSVTFTPNTSYVIDSVTVTMGGVNITNTAYSNGTVTIGEVTGDIVIAIATSTTILYDLTEPMSFTDGTTTFDTGVKLFAESDMDWSIMYDITYDGNISSARFKEIVYCGTGSGADTMPFALEYDNNTGKFITRMYAYENATTTGSSRKGVIVHKKGTQKKTEYDITNTGGLSIASNKVFAQVDAPIYLGGIPSDLGLSFYNHENAKCTFNAFKVFSKALSQEEALALLEV